MKVFIKGNYIPVNRLSKLQRDIQQNILLKELLNSDDILISLEEKEKQLLEQLSNIRASKKQEEKIFEEKYNTLTEIIDCSECEKEIKFFKEWNSLKKCQTC